MQTKIYKLHKKYAAYFETKYCGVVVPMSFVMGMGSDPDQRAEMTVTDKFSQDAIEADPRFNKLYYLAEVYGEPDVVAEDKVEDIEPETEEATAKPKKRTKKSKAEENVETATIVDSVNDALYLLENEIGVDIPEDADINALLAKHNIKVKE